MKKLLVILAITFMLTACTNGTDSNAQNNAQPEIKLPQQGDAIPSVDNSTAANQTEIDESYFGKYQVSDDGFSEQVKGNAIDADYKIESTKFQASPEFNTQGWVELEGKYLSLWDKELNNTCSKLMKVLGEKQQGKLREAQKAWLAFHLGDSKFVSESWDELALGTIGRVQAIMVSKDRIRERTLQLMEYYYMLGGKVEFQYQGAGK